MTGRCSLFCKTLSLYCKTFSTEKRGVWPGMNWHLMPTKASSRRLGKKKLFHKTEGSFRYAGILQQSLTNPANAGFFSPWQADRRSQANPECLPGHIPGFASLYLSRANFDIFRLFMDDIVENGNISELNLLLVEVYYYGSAYRMKLIYDRILRAFFVWRS